MFYNENMQLGALMIKYLKRNVQYISIADELRRELVEKKPLPGTPLISCRELAKAYHVSVGTAEKAIGQLVSEELIYRKRGSGTYVRQLPRTIRRLLVGCTVRQPTMDYKRNKLISDNSEMMIDYIRKHHCDIRFIPNNIYTYQTQCEEYFKGLDGLLISACAITFEECRHLCSLKIPTVIFQGEYEQNFPFSQVIPDHMPGMREIFRLAKRWNFSGCIILHADHNNALARKKAFITAAEEFGLQKIESFETCETEAYKLGLYLAKCCRNKLILSCSDIISLNILNAFGDSRLVPVQDYQLVSYDNVEGRGLKPFPIPTVTAIDYDRQKATLLAAKMLLQEMQKRTELTHIIKIPTKLIIRETALKSTRERIII